MPIEYSKLTDTQKAARKVATSKYSRTHRGKINARRKPSAIKQRIRIKQIAASLGMSTKSYLASKYPSVQWAYAIDVIRKRCKKPNGYGKRPTECTITPSDLAKLWELQNGICPITEWKNGVKKIWIRINSANSHSRSS